MLAFATVPHRLLAAALTIVPAAVAIAAPPAAGPSTMPSAGPGIEARVTELELQIVALALRAFPPEDISLLPDEEEILRLQDGRVTLRIEPLATAFRTLPTEVVQLLPRNDGWGRALQLVDIGYGRLVLSRGADGYLDPDTRQALESLLSPDGRVERARLDVDDYAMSFDGEMIVRPYDDTARQRRSMADLRSIGTAIETYSIDNNHYLDGPASLEEVSRIAGFLEPIYIRRLPLLDGWGRPFLVRSSLDGYVILSFGADGLADSGDYDARGIEGINAGAPGARPGAEHDIVFIDGQFVAWPEGLQQ